MSEEADKALAAAAAAKVSTKEIIPEEEEKKKADPDVLEATKLGWKPEKEYEGEEGWVGAGEFMRRKPLYDAIHKEKRKSKKTQDRMEALVTDINAQKKAAVDKALAEIEQAKKVAAADGDIERYDLLHKRAEDTKYEPVPVEQVDKVFEGWQTDNAWYDTDTQLTRYADGYATELRRENPDMPDKELYDNVAEEVKKTFPTKFSNPNRSKAQAVTTNGAPAKATRKASGKISYGDLPEDAKTVYKLLVKSKNNPGGIRTSEEFLDSYHERGGELIERGN